MCYGLAAFGRRFYFTHCGLAFYDPKQKIYKKRKVYHPLDKTFIGLSGFAVSSQSLMPASL